MLTRCRCGNLENRSGGLASRRPGSPERDGNGNEVVRAEGPLESMTINHFTAPSHHRSKKISLKFQTNLIDLGVTTAFHLPSDGACTGFSML